MNIRLETELVVAKIMACLCPFHVKNSEQNSPGKFSTETQGETEFPEDGAGLFGCWTGPTFKFGRKVSTKDEFSEHMHKMELICGSFQ
jgi:hypothetical protein